MNTRLIFRRISALLLALAVLLGAVPGALLSALPGPLANGAATAAYAAPGDPGEPFVDSHNLEGGSPGDIAQFPLYPNPGSIFVDKQAEWVDDLPLDNVGRVTLTTQGQPLRSSYDVVLVLDSSSSMRDSACANPDHYSEVTFTKDVAYQVWTGAGWFDVSDTLTLTVTLHRSAKQTIASPVRLTVLGYRTEHQGSAVEWYRRSAVFNNTWSPSGWGDIPSNPNASASLLFHVSADAFGDAYDGISGYRFPLDDVTSFGVSYDFDTGSECYPRKVAAENAAKTFAQKTLKDADGSPNGNRIAVVYFGSSAQIVSRPAGGTGASPYFFDSAQLTALEGAISLPDLGQTNYTSGLTVAMQALDGREAAEKTDRPAYIVFLSDGAPLDAGGGKSVDTSGVVVFG
ncbi:MAG: VWA domain-containing protein, partial [Clostridiales bacterium]|nr:VWA domain-containing protein [Clostridiales bacterium]